MSSIAEDLTSKKTELLEFCDLTKRILSHMENVLTTFETKGNYRIYSSIVAGTTKYIRPINTDLFTFKSDTFENNFNNLLEIFEKIVNDPQSVTNDEANQIDKTLYTIQQSMGIGMDLLLNSNSARKHVGNRFEELIKAVFTKIQVSNKKSVLQIPYETEQGEKIYKCENDLILSPHSEVKSNSRHLSKDEVVVSIKTTSKDRMGKIFIDKLLLEKFVGHDQKIIGIFLNDVQRKEKDNISFTLVSNLFMVYTKFLTQLEGIYYLDPPPNVQLKPFKEHMFRFSKLITKDIFLLFSS